MVKDHFPFQMSQRPRKERLAVLSGHRSPVFCHKTIQYGYSLDSPLGGNPNAYP